MTGQTPTVTDVDGVLVIDWPHPRPTSFVIDSDVFEALVTMANIGRETERDG